MSVGGYYAIDLPHEVNSKFLEATINGLRDTQPICIRISSVKAIIGFFQAASVKNTILDTIRPQLPIIFEELLILSDQLSKEILTLVMNAFSILVLVL